jgi:hypothetical protein
MSYQDCYVKNTENTPHPITHHIMTHPFAIYNSKTISPAIRCRKTTMKQFASAVRNMQVDNNLPEPQLQQGNVC